MSEVYKDFFETAYRTGSDIWSKAPFSKYIAPLLSQFPENAMVLDLGTGRGRLAFRMVEEYGFKVIGIDLAESIVEKNNQELKLRGLEGKLRFLAGNATNVEFADGSFDGITDFGLFQHLPKDDWPVYIQEVVRLLKPRGFYLNVSLSKQTPKFGSFFPKKSETGSTVIDSIHYHFFTKAELNSLFQTSFEVTFQGEKVFPDFGNVGYVFTLFQKL